MREEGIIHRHITEDRIKPREHINIIKALLLLLEE